MKLIFDEPASRSLPTRLGWICATALLWALWISLWAPLLALTAWPLGSINFGIAGSYLQFPLALTMIGVESVVLVLAACVSISSSGLLLWSCLNYLRFRNTNRRRRLLPAQLEELADYSSLLSEKMAAWQKARRVIAHHDEHGRLLEAEVLHRDPQHKPARIAQGVKLQTPL
jgi:poly-beta-1,6-N-acetyl-D-glucosamine biosynthesis protein PgaD